MTTALDQLLSSARAPEPSAGASWEPGATAAGTVLTFLEPGRAVVWLTGEIDCAQDQLLTQLGTHLHLFAPHVVLDVSELTFCGSSVAAFIDEVTQRVPLTVLRPPDVLVDLLAICGLTDRVQIANFPGPGPAHPI